MNVLSRVFISSLSLLLILVILQVTGVANVSFAIIFSFVMMLVGLITFSWLFGSQRKVLLGSSAALFFFGLLWFLQKVFRYSADSKEFLLSVILVAGFTALMVYFEDIVQKKYLITALIILSFGVFLLFRNTGFSFTDALFWALEILKKMWLVFVVLIVYLLIISRNRGKEV
ncbi:MAG: hypothetical protein HYV28_12270 [Ignavibacteriales bacterium]|nr:hypothetical protein [Ignavibacteriales bacterium]